MDISEALRAMSALSSETRLWVLRLLVEAGEGGLSAGEIADSLGSRQNTMSTHLKQLHAAGLVNSRRAGRQVLYQADIGTVGRLVAFLAEDCCAPGASRPPTFYPAFGECPDQGYRLSD